MYLVRGTIDRSIFDLSAKETWYLAIQCLIDFGAQIRGLPNVDKVKVRVIKCINTRFLRKLVKRLWEWLDFLVNCDLPAEERPKALAENFVLRDFLAAQVLRKVGLLIWSSACRSKIRDLEVAA